MNAWLMLGVLGAALILVPWVLYPAVTIGWAPRAPVAPRSGVDQPDLLSVILATRESPGAVSERLQDLVAGGWPADRLELIVAVDGDPAGYDLAPLLPSPHRVRIVGRGAEPGKASALNAGVAAATGSVLVFTDTAQRFAPDAMPLLTAALLGGPYAAVSGALTIGNEADGHSPLTWYWRMERRLRAAEARWHSAIGVSGSIYAMRREHWVPVPSGVILDDLWVPMRLILDGHRIGFLPSAIAIDTRATDPSQEYRRKVRTLTGNLQLVAWLPGVLLPWRNRAWFQFWCHKLLRLATPVALLAVLVAAVGYAFTISPSAGTAVVLVLLAGPVIPFLVPGRAGRALRRGVRWLVAMQAATLRAVGNGIVGRWDVWRA